jgi:2-polyprenyl-6-methoxyphenol hydroxylase-like FAD-dependent oxidoreductase
LAATLEQAGFVPRVLDGSMPSSRGALLVWANAMRALRSIDRELDDSIANTIELTEIRDARGTTLSSLPIGDWSGAAGARSVVVRRADLIARLESGLAPGTVRRGDRVTGFAYANSVVTLEIEGGTSETVDLLVAADGINSPIRARLGWPLPRETGQEAWVGVAPTRPSAAGARVTTATVGHGPRFWSSPLPGGATFWFATRQAVGSTQDHRAELLATFAGWHEPIEELIAATPADEIVHTRIRDAAPLERWSVGPITLLGDAAHPTTPDLGQGACQAIESAVALGRALADAPTIAAALATYEQQRRIRTATVSRLSWMTATNSTTRDPFLCKLRDIAIRAALRPVAKYHLDWILRG